MILTYSSGYSNTCVLRDAIKELSGKSLRVTCYPERVTRLHVRYGNSSPVNCEDTNYNPPDFIRNCHKLHFSNLLSPHGFDVPIFHNHMPEESDFPLLIRQTMTGFSAQGIVVCRNMDDFLPNWNNRYYWTKFVHTSAEYRVHVFGNQIGRLFKKEFRGSEEIDLPIRNSYSDYHYSLRSDLGKFSGLVELVDQVSQHLTGKFYGLDVGWRPDTKNYFIFEANSGYGVNLNSALALAEYLISERVV
jgi:hypothetical protein